MVQIEQHVVVIDVRRRAEDLSPAIRTCGLELDGEVAEVRDTHRVDELWLDGGEVAEDGWVRYGLGVLDVVVYDPAGGNGEGVAVDEGGVGVVRRLAGEVYERAELLLESGNGVAGMR